MDVMHSPIAYPRKSTPQHWLLWRLTGQSVSTSLSKGISATLHIGTSGSFMISFLPRHLCHIVLFRKLISNTNVMTNPETSSVPKTDSQLYVNSTQAIRKQRVAVDSQCSQLIDLITDQIMHIPISTSRERYVIKRMKQTNKQLQKWIRNNVNELLNKGKIL